MSDAPQAPDPYATSAAQTKSNQDTAKYNAALNRVSTYTPYGNLVYSQTGTDASGAPLYRADVSLTPATQKQLDTQQRQNSAIADLGLGLTGQIGNAINSPLPDTATSGNAARDAYYQQQTAFLDPQWKNNQNDLEAKLVNQGIVQGSDAWNRAQDELGRQREFAYGQARNEAVTQGQNNQALSLQLATALKNQPINQLNALRGGTQIQNPTFQNAPSATAAGTDVAGNINQAYQNQLASYNNSMSGLFGIGSSILLSDPRLKTNVEKLGELEDGLGVYSYNYVWGEGPCVGVMADEVAMLHPWALGPVVGGYATVNYGALL